MYLVPIESGFMPEQINTIAVQASGRATADSIKIVNDMMGTSFRAIDNPFGRTAELEDQARCLHFSRA